MVCRLSYEDNSMKCLYCQGTMTRGTAPYHIDREDFHLVLDHLPAWVCTQCGEAYFEENEVAAIQEMIQSIERKTSALKLPA